MHLERLRQTLNSLRKGTLPCMRKTLPPKCVHESRIKIESQPASLYCFVEPPSAKEEHRTIGVAQGRDRIQCDRLVRLFDGPAKEAQPSQTLGIPKTRQQMAAVHLKRLFIFRFRSGKLPVITLLYVG